MNVTITANDKLVSSSVISKITAYASSSSKKTSSSSSNSYSNTISSTTGTLPASSVPASSNPVAQAPASTASFAQTLSAYTGRNIGGNLKSTDLASLYTLEDSFRQAASEYGVDVNLLKAVAKQESNFNVNCVSASGASGLMQLMPSTAASLGVQNVMDPHENIMGGAKYLSQMLKKFSGSTSLALAAYNAGEGAVQAARGIPTSARAYVNKVLGLAKGDLTIPDTKLYKYSAASADDIKNDITKMLSGITSLSSKDDYLKAYNKALEDYDEEHDDDDDDDDDDISDAEKEYRRTLAAADASVRQMIEKLRV